MPLDPKKDPSALSRNPISVSHDATEVIAWRKARDRSDAENRKRIAEIEAALDHAMHRARFEKGGGIDLSQCYGFGSEVDEIRAKIVEANSELAGIERAVRDSAAEREKEEVAAAAERSITAYEAFEAKIEASGETIGDWIARQNSPNSFVNIRTAPAGLHGKDFLAALFSTLKHGSQNVRRSCIAPSGRRHAVLAEIIPTFRAVKGDSVSYVKENLFSPAAALKAEGTASGEASFGTVPQTETFRTIIYDLPVSEQILQDSTQARRYIDTVLPLGCFLELDRQLAEGSGLDQQFQGLKGLNGVTNIDLEKEASGAIKGFGDGLLDAKRKMRNDVNGLPTHFVLNSTSWTDDVLKKETARSSFFGGDPWLEFSGVAWGIPVVEEDRFERGASKRTGVLLDLVTGGIYMVLCEDFTTMIGIKHDYHFRVHATIKGTVRAAFIVERAETVIALTQAA